MNMNKNKNKNNRYLLFWLSQSISQLGSSLTSFALVVWAYKQTGEALTVSILSFCSYMPYILVSVFAGALVDRYKKKNIMLISDTVAALGSIGVLILYLTGELEIEYLYGINFLLGLMNAFQSPATSTAIGIIVPPDKYEKISGMNAFSRGLITIVTPMLAPFFLVFGGLKVILIIDLGSFFIAFIVLLFFIAIKEEGRCEKAKTRMLESICDGFNFLRGEKAILYLMLSMAVMNFFSRLTYENILTPMLLERSGQSNQILGTVTGIIGFGGVVGGLIVSIIPLPKNKVKVIFGTAAFSFLCGDLLMGMGQSVWLWIIAALAASLPIPILTAAENSILYTYIPRQLQGRVFAIRNMVQFFTIPVGTLLGGILADYVFTPFMKSDSIVVDILRRVVGSTNGSGMAIMFICTGILGSMMSMTCYHNRYVKRLEEELMTQEK